MLVQFPTSYPDEDIRSIIYRYHVRSPNETFAQTKKDIFGLQSSKSSIFPKKLNVLASKLPSNYDVKYLLNHTYFPLINLFLASSIKDNVLEEILANNDDEITRANFRLTTFLSSSVKYCPQCMIDDFNNVGESYIHLMHQLRFLHFCPKHLCELTSSCKECGIPYAKKFCNTLSLSPKCAQNHEVSITLLDKDKSTKFIRQIVDGVFYLFNNYNDLTFELIKENFRVYFLNEDYLFINNQVNKKKLVRDMINKYGLSDIETLVQIPVNEFLKKKNLSFLFSDYYKSYLKNIPFYIGTMIYLGGSVKDFFENAKQIEPFSPVYFGNGPWKCLNTKCEWNKLNKIVRCKRHRIKYEGVDKIVGVFECSNCRCTFSITKDIKADTEKYKFRKSGNILKEYRVTNHIRVVTSIEKQNFKIKTTQKYRTEILKILNENPGINRSQIYKLATNKYVWLNRWDNEWLESVLPKINRGRTLLNLKEVDEELANIILIASSFLKSQNPNSRVRKYTILNALPPLQKGRYMQYKVNLPLSEKVLDDCEEKYDEYNLRKLPKVFAYLRSVGYKRVEFHALLGRYGYNNSSYKHCSEEGKKLIIEKLESLNGT